MSPLLGIKGTKMQTFRTQGSNIIENVKLIILTLSISFLLSVSSAVEAEQTLADLIGEIKQSSVEYKSDVDLNHMLDLRSTEGDLDRNKSAASSSSARSYAGLEYIGTVRLGNDEGYCMRPTGNLMAAVACAFTDSQNLEIYQRSDGYYEICVPGSVTNPFGAGSQVIGTCMRRENWSSFGEIIAVQLVSVSGNLSPVNTLRPFTWIPTAVDKGKIGLINFNNRVFTRVINGFSGHAVRALIDTDAASQIWTPLPRSF